MTRKLVDYSKMLKIGQNIRRLRDEKCIMQKDLAEKMDISITMISRIENGLERITLGHLIEVCTILSVSADEVLGINGK